MRRGAVEESVCQWCGVRIYLVRVSINNWEWITDLKRPRALGNATRMLIGQQRVSISWSC